MKPIIAFALVIGMLSACAPFQPVIQTAIPLNFTPEETADPRGVIMSLVPAGSFTLGSNSGHGNWQPVETLTLRAFYMDIYEVTNLYYKACVDAGACQAPQNLFSFTRPSYYGNPAYDNYPVLYVDWIQAETYCNWRGGRLPTEAEWEYAARGPDGRTYPWGEGIDPSFANYDPKVRDTTAVGSYEKGKNLYGLYDMAGNVWEWTSSLYLAYPYNAGDGREDPSAPGARVFRGGEWGSDRGTLQSFVRGFSYPLASYDSVGFRCARSQ